MTSSLIPIYGSSFLAIGVLALFAIHNRKTGWKKQRGPFAQWLSGVYHAAYVEETSAAPGKVQSTRMPSWVPVTPSEAAGFSEQLITLRGSLGVAGKAPEPVQKPARVMVYE